MIVPLLDPSWIRKSTCAGAPAVVPVPVTWTPVAALIAAAERPERVRAVVSRGGRPDLAEEALERVLAPTLLIVGGYDHAVLELNQLAAQRLRCPHSLEIVLGATHLFEERGALDQAAELEAQWFSEHMGTRFDRFTTMIAMPTQSCG